MGIRIGSFNVCNLSYNEKNENTSKNLTQIAKLLLEMNCHIIVLQEVLSEGKMLKGPKLDDIRGQAKAYEKSLLGRMGDKWECLWIPPGIKHENHIAPGSQDRRGEGSAVFWKKDNLELVRKKESMELPFPYTSYSVPRAEEPQARLIRDPGIARFRIKGRPVEIRLIIAHILSSSSSKNREQLDEFALLAGRIYKKIDSFSRDARCTEHCTVLLGDYNLNLESSDVPAKIRVPDIAVFDRYDRMVAADMTGSRKMYTLQNQRTTLKSKEPGLANNFDHFTIDGKINTVVRDVTKDVAVINRIKELYPLEEDEAGKYATYRAQVSDHLPIVINLHI